MSTIRPFTYRASDAELDELRRRVLATRLPEKETTNDLSQGVPLATVQKLAITGRPSTTGARSKRS
jgi:hypothetical protein